MLSFIRIHAIVYGVNKLLLLLLYQRRPVSLQRQTDGQTDQLYHRLQTYTSGGRSACKGRQTDKQTSYTTAYRLIPAEAGQTAKTDRHILRMLYHTVTRRYASTTITHVFALMDAIHAYRQVSHQLVALLWL